MQSLRLRDDFHCIIVSCAVEKCCKKQQYEERSFRTSSAFLEALSTAIEEKSVAVPFFEGTAFHSISRVIKSLSKERDRKTLLVFPHWQKNCNMLIIVHACAYV